MGRPNASNVNFEIAVEDVLQVSEITKLINSSNLVIKNVQNSKK
jgi:hypothetical protein